MVIMKSIHEGAAMGAKFTTIIYVPMLVISLLYNSSELEPDDLLYMFMWTGILIACGALIGFGVGLTVGIVKVALSKNKE